MRTVTLRSIGTLLFIILLALTMFPLIAIAQSSKIAPSQSAVLNEFAPDTSTASFDYYVGIFEVETKKYSARTLLRFDFENALDLKNKHVLNAYLELDTSSKREFLNNEPLDISVHNVREAWEAPTWNMPPEVNTNRDGTATIGKAGIYRVILTDTVKAWAANPFANHGILLRAVDESKQMANLKQIQSISLVVEYEDVNECNINNGVCRRECGSGETKLEYSCGGGRWCCIEKNIMLETPTATTIISTQKERDQYPQIIPSEEEIYALNTILGAFQPIKKSRRGNEKDTAEKILDSAVKKRRAIMKSLAKENPEQFIENAISTEEKKIYDGEIKNQIEEEIAMEGNFEILHTDYFEDGRSENRYFISREVGGLFGLDIWPFKKRIERFNFYPVGEPHILGGSKIRIKKGYVLGNDFVADIRTKDEREIIDGRIRNKITGNVPAGNAEEGDNLEVIEEVPFPDTVGAQKVAVILVKDEEKINDNKWDINKLPKREEVHETIFNGNVQGFFREASYGKMWLEGDTFGWYDLPGICKLHKNNIYDIQKKVLDVASKDIDFNKYNHMMIGLTGCGGAYFDVKWSTFFIFDFGIISPGSFEHEFGHQLVGGGHANLWECGENSIYGECMDIEYGNHFDIMGYRDLGQHFNAKFKETLGWISVDEGSIIDIKDDGNYILKPFEYEGVKVARIHPKFPNAFTYYLEYRIPSEHDKPLNQLRTENDGTKKQITNNDKGIFINFYPAKYGGYTYLVDTTPHIENFDAERNVYDYGEVSLLPEKTFFDGGLSITNIKEDRDSRELHFSVKFEDEPKCLGDNLRLELQGPGYLGNKRKEVSIRPLVLKKSDLAAGYVYFWLRLYRASGPYCLDTEHIGNTKFTKILPEKWYVLPEKFDSLNLGVSEIYLFIPKDAKSGEYKIPFVVEEIETGLKAKTELAVRIIEDNKVFADVNKDGLIDIADLVIVSRAFGGSGGNFAEDLNKDNKIDIEDLILVVQNFD